MQTEIEAKFLDADHESVRRKLKELGATCEQPMRLMRRKHFDYPDFRLGKKGGFVRVRDEGNKITLSYKQVDDLTINGTKEVTVAVNSFEEAEKLLGILGLKVKSFHESQRESWRLGDIEVELDEWPWLPPFVEVEAASEKQIWHVAGQLGLDKQKAVHGTVDFVYARYYDITESEVNSWPEILFATRPYAINK